MLRKLNNYLKLSILIFGISMLFVKCQKEDDSQSIDSIDESQKVISKIVTGKDVPFIIDFIKSKSNDDLEFIIKDNGTPNAMQRNDEDDLILTTVLTDYVNQVTNSSGISNYSFEMEEISDADGYYFLNLVVKEYNDNYYISIIKYVPDPLWLTSSTKSQDFSEYTGSMYFYDEQGVYLANMTFNDGSSTDFGYDPPCTDGGNGDWIGDNDITGGAGVGGIGDAPCISVFIECGGTNSSTPHPATICGAESGTGSYWTTCEDTGYDGTGTTWADAFNNYLQDPCGYGDTGSGSSGTGDNNNCNITCEFPLEVDENCNCVEAEFVVVGNTSTGILVSDVAAMKNINTCLDSSLTSEQKSWLLLDENEVSLFAINDYINDNNCSSESAEFAELAIEALMDGDEVDLDEKIIYTINKECQEQIVKDIISVSSTFTEMIKNTFNDSESVSVKFWNGETPGGDPAYTNPFINNNTISIGFNDEYLDTATNLSIMVVTLHELSHAYFISLYNQGSLAADSEEFDDLLNSFIAFFEDMTEDTFTTFDNELHNAMFFFINQMAQSLFTYTQANNMTDVTLEYCKKLVWGSMFGTSLFNEILTEDQRIEYGNIAATEQDNLANFNPQGTPCEE